MAEKTQANIGFEKQIWDAACVLWGHIPAAEYRKVIIGLIFLRYGFAFKGDDITTDNNGIVLVTPGNFAIGGGFKEEKCKFFKGDYPSDYVS